jgi:hypothetical protein
MQLFVIKKWYLGDELWSWQDVGRVPEARKLCIAQANRRGSFINQAIYLTEEQNSSCFSANSVNVLSIFIFVFWARELIFYWNCALLLSYVTFHLLLMEESTETMPLGIALIMLAGHLCLFPRPAMWKILNWKKKRVDLDRKSEERRDVTLVENRKPVRLRCRQPVPLVC